MVHVTAELIAGHAAGGLTARERLGVALHLVRCVTCRALRDEYERAWSSLAHTAPRIEPPRALRAKVLDRARGAGRSHPGRPLRAPGLPRRAFALASVVLVGAFALSIVIPAALAPTPALGSSTTLSVFGGSVEIERGGTSAWQSASDGAVLFAQDRLRTAAGSRAVLTFFDGSTLTLEAGTEVRLEDLGRDHVEGTRSIVVFQSIGRTWSAVQRLLTSGSRYEIRTPSATATVRGTGFEVAVSPGGSTTVTTTEGAVAVSTDAGEVLVTADRRTVVETPAAAPSAPVRVAPRHELRFRANVGLVIVTPSGLACGRAQDGTIVRQAPRCDVGRGEVTLADPEPGEYRAVLRSDGAADARLAVRGTTDGEVSFERTTGIALGGGEQALTALTLGERGGILSAGELSRFETVLTSPARIVLPPDRPVPADEDDEDVEPADENDEPDDKDEDEPDDKDEEDELEDEDAEGDEDEAGVGDPEDEAEAGDEDSSRDGDGTSENERDQDEDSDGDDDSDENENENEDEQDEESTTPLPTPKPRSTPSPSADDQEDDEDDDTEEDDEADEDKRSPTPRPSVPLPRVPTVTRPPSLPTLPPGTPEPADTDDDDDEDEDEDEDD